MQLVELNIAKARAINADNSNATPVFISGATGFAAARINGSYAPTHVRGLDGRVVYRKIGDVSMCIEHRTNEYRTIDQKGVPLWQVKFVSSQGTDGALAALEGGAALDACASGVWNVANESGTAQEQTGCTMLTGQEAQQAVSTSATSLLFPLQNFSFKFSQNFTFPPGLFPRHSPFFAIHLQHNDTCLLRRLPPSFNALLKMIAPSPMTTRRLLMSSYLEPRAPVPSTSTGCSRHHKTKVGMVALYTARRTMGACASSTVTRRGK